MSEIATKNFIVEGMSCEHCRSSVLEEVGELAGVDSVDVDLASGRLEVRGDVSDEAVVAAVEDAGYSLAGRA